ncbi:MAG: hypothetical protein ACLT4C_09595 [Butyricicoccus sp.]
MSVPYVLCAVVMFCVPHSSTTVQFWAFLLITCATVCYTAISLRHPVPMMTRSSHERDRIRCAYGCLRSARSLP